MYFPDVDHEGHVYGPDSSETRAAVVHVDAVLGKLFDEIRATRVAVNIFVVSDHGMIALDGSVEMGARADLSKVTTAEAATDFKPYSSYPAQADSLYTAFHGKDSRFRAYRQDEIPATTALFRQRSHRRCGRARSKAGIAHRSSASRWCAALVAQRHARLRCRGISGSEDGPGHR